MFAHALPVDKKQKISNHYKKEKKNFSVMIILTFVSIAMFFTL